MTSVVWAYSDLEGIANEVLTAAEDVAKGLSGTAIMVDVGGERGGTASHGGRLVIKGLKSATPSPEEVAESLFRASKDASPSVILVGSTKNGREVAARLSVRMSRGCLSDVARLFTDGKSLFGERGEYAGKVQTRVAASLPCLATVKAGSYAPASGKEGATTEAQTGEFAGRTRTSEVRRKEVATVDLRAAKIIISAGRGVKKKEDLAIVEGLARAMGGTLGCSRPLSSDLGWLPEEYHIGLTGVNVKPDLYVAVGISGQLQHIAGIKDSRVIAAINTDKEAPIFQAADYGVVGDLYKVVPALEKLVNSRRR